MMLLNPVDFMNIFRLFLLLKLQMLYFATLFMCQDNGLFSIF